MTARNKAIKERINEATSLSKFIQSLELPPQKAGGVTNDNYQKSTSKEYRGLERSSIYKVKSKSKRVKVSPGLAAIKGIH